MTITNTVVSLFSGAGGMDYGFEGGFTFLGRDYPRTPFKVIWANDINRHACTTYRHNIGPHVVHGDVWEALESLPATADVVIGGFPCQDVSLANHSAAGIEGSRTSLYRAMVEAIARLQPRVFVAENVKGLLSQKHMSGLHTIHRDFAALGYVIHCNLYNCADYGVPQTRERVFIVGVRRGERMFMPPSPTHAKLNYVTARQALHDLEMLEKDERINHIWSNIEVTGDSSSRRLTCTRPGFTVLAQFYGYSPWHYALPRRISLREEARLQSFPDTFLFHGPNRQVKLQIGNAVPPVMAWHIANALTDCLNSDHHFFL